MANKFNNRRYNKLLNYRDKYYNLGEYLQRQIDALKGNPDKDGMLTTGLFKGMSVDNANMIGSIGTVAGELMGGAIAGGKESKAGNMIGNVTSTVSNVLPGPWKGIIDGGGQLIAGGINALTGTKYNWENINAIKEDINRKNNFKADANSFDSLASLWSDTTDIANFSKSHLGSGKGIKSMFNTLQSGRTNANAFVNNSLTLNAENLKENQVNNLEQTYSAALGGFLHQYGNGGPKFNPFAKLWYDSKGNLMSKLTFDKLFGKTVYTKDGFAVNYNKKGVEIGRTKGTRTPYITGKTRNEREQNYFNRDKELTDSVKVISKRYGLSPNLVASRLAREGVDPAIDYYNNNGGDLGVMNDSKILGAYWGLDDVGSRIQQGKINIIEPWVKYDINEYSKFKNEKGRIAQSAFFDNMGGIISATAAELKARRDEIKKKYPKMSNAQLDAAASASFNLGETGVLRQMDRINNYKPFINLKAYGGALHQYADGGSIHIDPKNVGKFNATKKRTGKSTEQLTHSKNPLTRKRAIFAQNATGWKHGFGGNLNTNGANFSTGLVFIDAGGSHESNPYGGVPMGIASDGQPQLVEQHEAIYKNPINPNLNDYVLSNRILIDEDMKTKYKLKGKDLTFADGMRQIEKIVSERPNDKIAQDTLEDIMTDFIQAQEAKRMEDQYKEANYAAYGGKLGDVFAGPGPRINRMRFNNSTPGITWQEQPDYNVYNDDGSINFDKVYASESPYMKRRQYLLDNWDTEQGTDFRKKYIEGVNEYNKNKEGYTPYTFDTMTKDIFSQISNDYNWGAGHSGIIYMGATPNSSTVATPNKPEVTRSNRYFLRTEDGDAQPLPVTPWEGMNKQGKYFSDIYPNYIYVDKQERPEENNNIYTDYYYDLKKKEEEQPPIDLGTSSEAGRKIGIGALGAIVSTDSLGLTNNPDYGDAARIEALLRGNNYKSVAYEPIGLRLGYNPFDRNYYSNKLNAQASASRRAIANQSDGNSGRAIAGILSSDYNFLGQLADQNLKGEEYNFEQRYKDRSFSKDVLQANSSGKLQADMANQSAFNSARDYYLNALAKNIELRQRERLASDEAKSANISNFLQALMDEGYENKSMNMLRRAIEANVFGPISEGHPLWKGFATPSAQRKYNKKLTDNKKTTK